MASIASGYEEPDFQGGGNQCSYCGKAVYHDCFQCPHCGAYTDGKGPLAKERARRKGRRERFQLAILIIFIAIPILAAILGIILWFHKQ